MSATARTMTARAVTAVRELDRPLALLAAMAFITQLGVAVMLPLLPLYATQLGASPTVLGLLTSAFGVTNAIGQLAGGFLAERFPARRLVPSGIGVYAGANILIATAVAAVPLVAFRALAGLGAGLNQVAERLYVTQVTASAKRAFANGVLSAAGAGGSVAGPALGGLLAAVSDLRVPFILVGVTSALATGAALFLPRPRREAMAPAADLSSVAEGIPSTVGAVELAPSTAPLARRPLAILLVSNLALMSGFGAFITTYAPFVTTNLGWSKAEVGIVFSMFGLGSIALGPWLARRADRTGRRQMAILGAIPVVLFPLVLAAALPRPIVYAVSIVAGGGLTAFEASWFALLAGATDEGRRGRAFGFVTAASNLGSRARSDGRRPGLGARRHPPGDSPGGGLGQPGGDHPLGLSERSSGVATSPPAHHAARRLVARISPTATQRPSPSNPWPLFHRQQRSPRSAAQRRPTTVASAPAERQPCGIRHRRSPIDRPGVRPEWPPPAYVSLGANMATLGRADCVSG